MMGFIVHPMFKVKDIVVQRVKKKLVKPRQVASNACCKKKKN